MVILKIKMKCEFRIALLFGLLILPCSVLAESPSTFPAEVKAFIERREICDHFRGEFTGGSSPERDAAVILEQKKYCGNSDRDLETLRKKFEKNPEILSALAKYEAAIESK